MIYLNKCLVIKDLTINESVLFLIMALGEEKKGSFNFNLVTAHWYKFSNGIRGNTEPALTNILNHLYIYNQAYLYMSCFED